MVSLKNLKIKHKLTLIILLSIIIVLSLSFAIYISMEWGEMKREVEIHTASQAKMLGYNTKAAILFEDSDDAEEVLKSVFIDESVLYAAIYTPDKKVFASKVSETTDSFSFKPQDDILERGKTVDGLHFILYEPVLIEDEVVGIVCLVTDLSETIEEFYNTAGKILLISLLIVIIGYFVAVKLQNIIVKPINDLLELTGNVSQTSDYSLRGEKKTDDEIGDLVVAFNNMLSQIQQRDSELNDANRNLEEKVEQRTLELQSSVEKLNESNQQLQQFTYIASHDLREPVRKISSFGQLLNDSLKGTLSEDDQENLEFMIDGANRMQSMIEALLTYSRVTTKEIEMKEIDLNEITEQLKTLELAVRIEETDGEIDLPQELPIVQGDSDQIRQLMQNFVGNALKYIPKGTKPYITIKAIDQPDNMVRIEVQDNGIGIKPDHFENVFVMFRRLHSRSQYEGTGIGLAVCKKIVDRHGGNIGVESIYGEGSTFWFTLKKSDNNKQEQEMEKKETVQLGN